MAEEDLFQVILSHWGFWILLITIVIYLIVMTYMKNKGRPEEQPYYGEKVRRENTEENIKRRLDVFGVKKKMDIKQGLNVMGKLIAFETVTRITQKKTDTQKEVKKSFFLIGFRKIGLMGYLKYLLGKYEKILLEPTMADITTSSIIIDPSVYFTYDAGVWNPRRNTTRDFIEEVTQEKDSMNIKGFVSDQPRRLASLEVRHAANIDRLETEAKLAEEARRSKTSSALGLGK